MKMILKDFMDINICLYRTNNNGFAGGNVSAGCLLIVPTDWNRFNSTMSGIKDFKVRLHRSSYENTNLMGVNGNIPGITVINKKEIY